MKGRSSKPSKVSSSTAATAATAIVADGAASDDAAGSRRAAESAAASAAVDARDDNDVGENVFAGRAEPFDDDDDSDGFSSSSSDGVPMLAEIERASKVNLDRGLLARVTARWVALHCSDPLAKIEPEATAHTAVVLKSAKETCPFTSESPAASATKQYSRLVQESVAQRDVIFVHLLERELNSLSLLERQTFFKSQRAFDRTLSVVMTAHDVLLASAMCALNQKRLATSVPSELQPVLKSLADPRHVINDAALEARLAAARKHLKVVQGSKPAAAAAAARPERKRRSRSRSRDRSNKKKWPNAYGGSYNSSNSNSNNNNSNNNNNNDEEDDETEYYNDAAPRGRGRSFRGARGAARGGGRGRGRAYRRF